MVRFKQRYLLATLTFPAALPNTLADTSGASESSHAVRALAAAADTSNGNSAGGVSEAGLVHLLRDSLAVNFGDAGAGAVGGSFSSARFCSSALLLPFADLLPRQSST